MKSIAWVLLLALAWTSINGEFTVIQLTVGFGLGTMIMLFVRPESRLAVRKGWVLARFILFFTWELVVANLRVALVVLTPGPLRISPGVVAVPLQLRGDVQLTMLANLLALTPGTLSLDISEDGRMLYVHGLWVADPDEARRETHEGFERRIQELFS